MLLAKPAAAQWPGAGRAVWRSTDHTMTSGGLQREYILYAPSSETSLTKRALIIVLHGSYGSGQKMERGLGFNPYASKQGFLVAYPDAYRLDNRRQTTRWNDGRGVLKSSDLKVNDVGFINDMISDIARTHPLDERRIFVTGASNGGIMAYRIGCELAARVRAIAPVISNVAAPIAGTCAPAAGLSILAINGDSDAYIPLNGGKVCPNVSKLFCEGGYVVSRDQSVGYFSAANGCSSTPIRQARTVKVNDGTWIEEFTFKNCANGADVRSLVGHGMGHVWPPNPGQIPNQPTTRNLDATEEIVKFFMSFK